jgi:two-component system nitrogen regulation sensor histidine kinase NtrY
LDSVKQLHENNEKVDFSWSLIEEPAVVHADKTHINRLFTNLVLNAIQSVPADRKPIIDIKEVIKHDRVQVEIKDNGDGIPESVQSKIFTPNFTTKSSGTGLGLAMCKRIVEQANGSIWFETIEGAGTSFFVSLPLSKMPA